MLNQKVKKRIIKKLRKSLIKILKLIKLEFHTASQAFG
jgi:hypothetical protein